ncbi:hypothetical protein E4K72_19780 [Oxalobacteraceae bacterium OM1]|nr:hypothetical protein E4K72_19780 [Oxalobacteraceae bacterium OM1]
MPTQNYPFIPKSTRHLKRGQFWAIPLDGGRFGAGCVVGVHAIEGKSSTRMFIAGVVSWSDVTPPTSEKLAGRFVVDFAFAHLKAVTETGGMILGEAAIDLSNTPLSAESLSIKTWGFGVPKLLAQRVADNGS